MKSPALCLSVIATSVTLTAACGSDDSAPKETHQLNSVSTAVVHKNTSTTFSKVFPGDWDSAVVACPDIPATALKAAVGSDWKGASKYGKLSNDQQIVVLMKNKKVQAVDKSSRKKLDLCGQSEYPKKVSPSTKLAITEDKWSDGSTYLAASYK